MKKIKVILTKSPIDKINQHKKTLKALGLRRIGSSAVFPDNPAIRGMLKQISYMIKIQEIKDAVK